MKSAIPRFLGAVSIVVVALTTSADASAPAGRYQVTGGGTDAGTGNGTVYDTKTKLTWQQTVPSTTYTWANAKTYCGSAAVSTSLGGTGWRLPTLKELQTIVDYSQSNPSIDSTAFPSTPGNVFWSSSPLAGSSSNAWSVDFGYGYTGNVVVSNPRYVRCVR